MKYNIKVTSKKTHEENTYRTKMSKQAASDYVNYMNTTECYANNARYEIVEAE